MSIELKMPALSPTMEKGTLARWLVREGDIVKSGDQVAEIETDKATMEFEIAEEGVIAKILIPEGTDDVAVGTVIALLGDSAETTEPAAPAPSPAPTLAPPPAPVSVPVVGDLVRVAPSVAPIDRPFGRLADKVKVSPLAARVAAARNIDLTGISGSGPNGRIVRADLGLPSLTQAKSVDSMAAQSPSPAIEPVADVPHELIKLSNMRRTIARRLVQSKQQVPHIYLGVDIRLDALLALRIELNEGLAARGVKISVNDMMVRALALALMEVPACNVQFAGDYMAQFERADISVAVSIPNGLITPVVKNADAHSLSAIAVEMKGLAARARDGKLQPHEYQGGTASLSNLGMFGIKQFQAVINPPQAMIMAIGSGNWQAVASENGIESQQILTATGSFDHRVIDGADAASLMKAFRELIEEPLRLVA